MALSKIEEADFRKKLEKLKIELEAQIAKLEAAPEDFGSDTDHLEEETNETAAFGTQLGVAQTFRERLREVEGALERIKTGSYGICERCGAVISMDLLVADPETSICKDCKLNER